MNRGNLFSELKRRNVLRAVILYVGAVWALAQGISQLGPSLGAPEWATRWFLVAAGIGFPFWIAFAWFYEFTPQGLKRESEIDPADSIAHRTGRKLDFAIIGVLAVAVVLLLTDRFVLRHGVNQASALPIPEKSIAVLPFENLSEEKENAYFTDGVQDEILTDLAKIADLKVISRTSVMQYKSGIAVTCAKIGQQLGVAHVLEGSVQRAANKVRVIAQLIDARTDAHLWAQTYDRDLADVFAIQSEIAKAIADQLQAKLSPNGEKNAIGQPPAKDLATFDLYSRAKSLLLTSFGPTGDPDLGKAIELLDEAVKHDPSFFDAYCQLAYAHEQLYSSGMDHTPARLALGQAALQTTATRLQPDAGEAHLARAQYLYFVRRDYDGSLAGWRAPAAFTERPASLRTDRLHLAPARPTERKGCAIWNAPWSWIRATFLPCNRSRLVMRTLGVMLMQSLRWIAPSASSPITSKPALYGQNLNSSTRPIRDRSTRRLMRSSRKDRTQSPRPRMPGSDARWRNAIRLRPSELSLPWTTMSGGAKTRSFLAAASAKGCWQG